MPVVVLANPRGGVGRPTPAINRLGHFSAQEEHAVMLGEADRQQSVDWRTFAIFIAVSRL